SQHKTAKSFCFSSSTVQNSIKDSENLEKSLCERRVMQSCSSAFCILIFLISTFTAGAQPCVDTDTGPARVFLLIAALVAVIVALAVVLMQLKRENRQLRMSSGRSSRKDQ
ncbi:hypothetical protein SRHO_G00256680, partial [Serrasalmus rhombeus]